MAGLGPKQLAGWKPDFVKEGLISLNQLEPAKFSDYTDVLLGPMKCHQNLEAELGPKQLAG